MNDISQRPAWVRPTILAAAAVASFGMAFHFRGSGDDGVVQSIDRGGNAPSQIVRVGPTLARAAAEEGAAPDLPTRNRIAQSTANDPFAARDWLPPPPPPPPPVETPPPPPPPPTAPPVPFRFVGLLAQEASKPAAFIAKGDALFVVHVGDVVENTYGIESFNSSQVVVTYLPLRQRQTIDAIDSVASAPTSPRWTRGQPDADAPSTPEQIAALPTGAGTRWGSNGVLVLDMRMAAPAPAPGEATLH